MNTSRAFSLKLLLSGIFVSTLGQSFTAIGFSLLAAQSGSSALLSAVLMAELIPAAVLGLFGGVLADGRRSHWWWPVSLLVNAVILAVMAQTLNWSVIIVGSALMSGVSALTGPVGYKLAVHYSDNHASTGAMLSTISGSAGIIGVSLGGVGFGIGLLPFLLGCASLSYLIFAAVGFLVSTRDANVAAIRTKPKLTAGLILLSSPHLFGKIGLVLVVTTVLSTSFDDISVVFLLTHVIGLTPTEYGITSAAWAIGIISGSQLMRFLPRRAHLLMVLSACGMGVAIAGTSLFLPGFLWVIALFLLGGVGNGGFNAQLNRVIMDGADSAIQGQAWAAFRWIVNICLLTGYVAGALWGADYPRVLGLSAGFSVLICAGSNLLAGLRKGRTLCR